ncbi:unnamed protein product [Mytilus coruscus]|uniref:Uncharacterized protein n=1 Tax=Mytilus coruscus TaxID=42192 RepID=A0A6J8AZI2_MYTCO|nr:unnamed protein product [Mytilus coruscus]
MADAGTIKKAQTKTYAEIASSEDPFSDQSLFECPNDWVCRTCCGIVNESYYCPTCPNDWFCQTCGHTAQYCNVDIVSSSEYKSNHLETGKCDKPQLSDLSNSNNSFTFNKQITDILEKQDSNMQYNQSSQNEKAPTTSSTDEKRQVKKKLNDQNLKRINNNVLLTIRKAWNISEKKLFELLVRNPTMIQEHAIHIMQVPPLMSLTKERNL